jgi:hypothetical protein
LAFGKLTTLHLYYRTNIYITSKIIGGGNINSGKGKNAFKITFAGNVGLVDNYGDPVGQWQANFHNVSAVTIDGAPDTDIDKWHFHTTAITHLSFVDYSGPPENIPDPDPPAADYNYVKFEATGKFNGEDGWKLRVNATDAGEGKDADDEIRIRLWEPGLSMSADPTYDSFDDFGSEGYHSRADLDGGNIQIHAPYIPPSTP